MHHDDGTPVRRRPSGVAEEDEYCCDRHLSVSCPCIDHFNGDDGNSDDNGDPTRRRQPVPTTASDNCSGGGRQRSSALYAPPTGTRASGGGGGFPRVNSAPVTPMAADCVDMTDLSALSALLDDVNEPLIRDTGGAITFV